MFLHLLLTIKSHRETQKNQKPCQKRKQIDVEPRKSICQSDLEPDSESDSESSSSSEEDSSADEPSEKHSSDEQEKPKDNLNVRKIDYDTIKFAKWVKVIYNLVIYY